MRLSLERFPAGAEAAARRGDVVVIVDALRASVTVAAALKAGVTRVMPVLSVEEALAYLGQPGYRVAGEREGARIPSFHYGNSPLELLSSDAALEGQTLILTTSNGTRCMAVANGASALLVGSLPNLSAVSMATTQLAEKTSCGISVVAVGRVDQQAMEDEYVARVIGRRLVEIGTQADDPQGLAIGSEDPASLFAEGTSGKHLTDLGYEEDVAFCAQTDILDVAPLYDGTGFIIFAWDPSNPG